MLQSAYSTQFTAVQTVYRLGARFFGMPFCSSDFSAVKEHMIPLPAYESLLLGSANTAAWHLMAFTFEALRFTQLTIRVSDVSTLGNNVPLLRGEGERSFGKPIDADNVYNYWSHNDSRLRANLLRAFS
jgi:hypothetical protein